MSMVNDIMAQLQQMGIDVSSGFGALATLGGGDISRALQGQYGLTESQLPSAMFQPLSKELIKGGLSSTYSPQIEATGTTLMDKMLLKTQGQAGTKAFGGFDASGGFNKFMSQAKDVYGKGMTDVLTSTGQQRASSLKSVQDMINQWQSQASSIKYG